MRKHELNLVKAYSSLLDETKLEDVAFTGNFPSWLAGSYISIGPAQFEVGQTHFKHWFDGFAMLKKFLFKEGRISFQNRFLQSQQYIKSNKLKKLHRAEFGTPENFLDKIKNLIKAKQMTYDNCNVNTTCILDNYIAMTESSYIIAFDPHDLDTLGPFHFDNDNIKEHLSLAHPHLDIATGEIINISIEIGKTNRYHLYKIKPHSKQREIIRTYISDQLFYIHSFTVTPNFIILTKSPLTISKFKLICGFPFNDTLNWQKKRPFYFVLISRKNGNIREIEADPFFAVHTINGYESGNNVIIDLICYKRKGNPYDRLYLSNLKSQHPEFMPAMAKRYILSTHSNRYQEETFSDDFVEFPRIHYKEKNGMDYEFVYTSLMQPADQLYFNAIQKLNVRTGKSMIWKSTDYYPGEAVFVSKPNSLREDEGVLLSIAYNIKNQLSSLVILDAQSMQQTAEVSLPFHLPLGIHGNFYRAVTCPSGKRA